MPLPNQNIVFEPFATLPASQLNDLVENEEALANGTGLEVGAVTPDKRSGGFYLNQVSFSAGVGSKVLTGFGFKPKMIEMISNVTSSNSAYFALGMAHDGATISQYCRSTFNSTSASRGQNYTTDSGVVINSSGSPEYAIRVTSFDEDGVTFNTTIDNGSAFRTWTIRAWA